MPSSRRRLAGALAWTFVWGALLAAAIGFGSKTVTVDDGTAVRTLSVPDRSVGALLVRLGLRLEDGDRVFPLPDATLRDGDAVVVRRAKAVRLIVGRGQPALVRTTAETVGGLIAELGFGLRPAHVVTPAPEMPLRGGETVRIERIDAAVVAESRTIKAETVKKADLALPRGVEKTASPGRDGRALDFYRAVYVNGVLTDVRPLVSRIVEAPMPKIVRVGARVPPPEVAPVPEAGSGARAASSEPAVLAINGQRLPVQKVLTGVVLTAYGPGPAHTGKRPGDPGYGMTAIGVRAKEGRTIAVDPTVIPLGSWVYIEGYGLYRAEDTGGGVRGRMIDLFFEDDRKADAFGYRRGNTVYVIGPHRPEGL
ncbi:MAG: DUF348 domain-containing protein [Hydrogenibacillus schlegelii]|uniref:DUF348 domain-containing protein n=1 Tax=Hydrogenibacillus schlegelii TaxID=1484 RepID=A0A947G931_HYDSH|nr:DUF348 domain-containing protein [Hydrogenibacillus schlegelii]